MKLRRGSYLLLGIALAVLLGVGLTVLTSHKRWPQNGSAEQWMIQVKARSTTRKALLVPPTPEVRVGTPEFYDKPVSQRYNYRNEFPADRTKWLPLYLIDTTSGQETRLGDDSYAANFGTMNEEYLLWFFRGIHAYELATGEDRIISTKVNGVITPQLANQWVAFARYNNADYPPTGTLYAANLETRAVITLTRALGTQGDGDIDAYFGISPYLAAWFEPPMTIVVYDLSSRQEIARLTDYEQAFNQTDIAIYQVAAGQSIVAWSRSYGYDLVTHSYFRIHQIVPPDWVDAPLVDMSRIQEENRILTWHFDMQDGTQRYVRAPLLDATPSTAPCIEGQNLVQNGDLESTTDHRLWQQSGSTTNLLVNDPPPGLANGGQWAIRLGRFNNAQQAIQQTVAIPSGVKGLTLTFAVRVHSWDLWGGDRLQLDLVDPRSGQSLLATPVQWTNTQLASGDWIPLQVAIQNWPGIDTPVTLVFRTQTDWAFPTDFTIDQVKLLTSCLSE